MGQRQAYGNIIKQNHLLMKDPDWTVQITHCFRESNKAADLLANEGVKQAIPMLVHTYPPLSTLPILFEDISSIVWPRILNVI